MRRGAIGLLIAFVVGWAALASGLRFNGSPSFPEGFYLVVHKSPQKGDLVFVRLPESPIVEMAKERGYLNVAWSPTSHLLKRLVAIAGDRVTIDSEGVEINGVRLQNSSPLLFDDGKRILVPYSLKDYILEPNEVLLMSDYNPASFDSRYFGPIKATSVESVALRVLTWD